MRTDGFLESAYRGQILPYFVGGSQRQSNNVLDVIDKYSQGTFARVALTTEADANEAIETAVSYAKIFRRTPIHQRRDILQRCAAICDENRESLARILVFEVGKPIRDARVEVERMSDCFRIASAEVMTMRGESFSLDVSARSTGYHARVERVAIGPILCITPFNFPFNLAAHKIAPAIATGCPLVLKPSSQTPVSGWALGQILGQAQMPNGSFSVLPMDRKLADTLIEDPRFAAVSFTGSPDVGWAMKSRVGRKKISLELGGNAAVIVDEDSDIAEVAARISRGAFGQAGQSCISVQRIIVHAARKAQLTTALLAESSNWKSGDPQQETTSLGPLISTRECDRVCAWVAEAVARGAKVLCGNTRAGNILSPTLLDNVARDLPVYRREVFGPVATIESFSSWPEAIDLANDSDFGLQAGVFTQSIARAQQAFRELEVGGVVLNDVPTFRADSMPYGGVKASGFGREGIRYAMEEMTELKSLITRL